MWKSRNSRFGTKYLYLLSHLAGPVFVFCFERFSCDPGWPPASRSSCLSPQRTGISGRCSYLFLLLLCLVLLMVLESSPRTSRIPGECSANEPSWPPQTNFFLSIQTHISASQPWLWPVEIHAAAAASLFIEWSCSVWAWTECQGPTGHRTGSQLLGTPLLVLLSTMETPFPNSLAHAKIPPAPARFTSEKWNIRNYAFPWVCKHCW